MTKSPNIIVIFPKEKQRQEQKESVVHLRMQKILRLIEEHFSEDITLSDLSASANISKSECSRCFKISMDTTPYKYLTKYRLSKAAQLLAKTDESVGNIAAAVGFHQISRFGKCFKEKRVILQRHTGK